MKASSRSRRRSRPLIRSTAAAGALLLGALALTGCGGTAGEKDDGKVRVAAAFYPLEFLTKEIGGSHVSVQALARPGVEPHDLELSPRQTGELSEADLAVHLKGLQPAVDEAIQQAEVENTADAASFATPSGHGHEKEHGDHGEEGHAEPGHEGHDHGSSGPDPHLWLDPVRYAQIAEGIGGKLAAADPAHKATYRKNTDRLVERLHGLDEEFRKGLAGKTSDTFVTTHSAFGYLAERYGLHEESVSGLDPESEPSGSRMKELHRIAREDDVSTVFFENSASNRTARTLAEDLKLKTGVLSPLETVEDPEKEDYFSVMRENLAALQGALGAR